MAKFKLIFILVITLVFIFGILMVLDVHTSFDDSTSLIPSSNSSDDINQSNYENGSSSADSNNNNNTNANSTSNTNTNKNSPGDKIDYDSKYYDSSYIKGLYLCNDLEQAFKDAKAHHRNVMIVFDQGTCINCEYLKEKGLRDSKIQKEINENFIILIVDTSSNPELASKLNIYGTPTTVILDENGNELHRTVGYESPSKYLNELKEASSK